jgi:hypothetical protein
MAQVASTIAVEVKSGRSNKENMLYIHLIINKLEKIEVIYLS